MSFNTALFRSLEKLRSELKQTGRYSQGRAPLVCSDDALYEITRLQPQRKEDFLCIKGLGKTFIDNYAEAFLVVIKKHGKQLPLHEMADSTKETWKKLENRLVNINRRNRLLFMPKLANKYAFDLLDKGVCEYNPFDIIFGSKCIRICNPISAEQAERDRYRKLTALIRETERVHRERGHYDLYIGYPFVQGRLIGENFDIRAPLALFPIKIDKEPTHISITLDKEKDIIYNDNLILAHFKFAGVKTQVPDTTIEEAVESSFIQEVLHFYESIKLNIDNRESAPSKFKQYMAKEFPAYANGILELKNNIILGNFPIFSNSIQKDFESILEEGKISGVLANFLLGVGEAGKEDFYSDSYAGDEILQNDEVQMKVTEHNLTYITDLNSSQENVITAIKKRDALVVEGPPGTGKSQTIASLISDFAGQGKSILMVSEKKAALDVVYSRLGELNPYAIMCDDTNNKQAFYSQISGLFGLCQYSVPTREEMKIIADEIDGHIKTLEEIAQKLYDIDDFGIEVYKLYRMNHCGGDWQSRSERYQKIEGCISEILFSKKYSELEECSKRFLKRSLLDALEVHQDFKKNASYFSNIKDNLIQNEIQTCHQEAVATLDVIERYNAKSFLGKLFSKKQSTAKVREFIEKYFSSYDNQFIRKLLREGFNTEYIKRYDEYFSSIPACETLSETEVAYGISVIGAGKVLEGEIAASEEVFSFIIDRFLQRFEAANREILHHIRDFKNIVDELSAAINKKKSLARQNIKCILQAQLSLDIVNSKRAGEIARKAESKRKMSIKKFLDNYRLEIFRGIKIWFMTPEVASEVLPLETELFDLVIFDEASQMYTERGVPSIYRGKKVVIAGDSKQLRPSSLGTGRMGNEIDDEHEAIEDAAIEEESLLDAAKYKYYPPVDLKYHYRSLYEELIAFSNHAFYKGKLYVSPNVKDGETPIEVHKVEGGVWANRSNIQEGRKVVELLKDFFDKRQNKESIGIITFNSSQRDLITDLIDEECAQNQEFASRIKYEYSRKKNGEDIGLFVKNIENVQGDERDVIIFSIGYAKNDKGKVVRQFGWLNQKGGENRLNVAITRAKRKVSVVTSITPAELVVEDSKNEGPRFLKKYLEYCFAVSEGDSEGVKQILRSFGDTGANKGLDFDSDFEEQVYNLLADKGFEVDTQIGIGGYSIDLAIKQNDNYILGIECDGKLYHSSKSARERDYHRQKYLESRGWHIHRIWSPNWWKNPMKEIDKIVQKVESLSIGESK